MPSSEYMQKYLQNPENRRRRDESVRASQLKQRQIHKCPYCNGQGFNRLLDLQAHNLRPLHLKRKALFDQQQQ